MNQVNTLPMSWVRPKTSSLILGLLLLAGVQELNAQLVSATSETLVNMSVTDNVQQNCAISMDTLGRYAVVWESDGQDGDGFGVYAKVFNADHTVRVADFLVNSTTTGDQRFPDVAMNADGTFCVAWQSSEDFATQDWDCYRRIYDIDGAAVTFASRMNSSTAGNQIHPAVAAGDARFVTTWASEVVGEKEFEIQARIFLSNGANLSSTLSVDNFELGKNKTHPDVTMSPTGEYAFAWQVDGNDGDRNGVFTSLYSGTHVFVSGPTQVNTTVAGNQQEPRIAMDENGEFMIVWSSYDQDGDNYGIYGQRFDNTGTTSGGEIAITTNTTGSQDHAAIAVSREGGVYTISWTDDTTEGDRTAIYSRSMFSNGDFLAGDERINTTTTGFQSFSDVALGTDATQAAFVWQSGIRDGITAQTDPNDYGIYSKAFIIDDLTPPTAVCQNINVYLDGAGNANISAADVDGGSTDNLPGLVLSVDRTAFACADLGSVPVTLTATDASSNSATCMAIVTILDTVSPAALCQNVSVFLDGAGNASITAADIDNGSTDNCTIVTLAADITTFTCADLGANTVVLTVTDGSGNTSSCTSTVTVSDTISPTASCQNITVFLDGAGTASIVAADIDGGSTDNCGAPDLTSDITSFTCSNLGTNTVTLTVSDESSNQDVCQAVVTVVDSISPTIICPGDIVETVTVGSPGNMVSFATPSASDNCGSASVVCIPASGSFFPVGITTVTCTVSDGNGNEDQCTFDVVVQSEASNDECIDAIAIDPSIFGESGWQTYSLGTSGSGGCAGDADDDVWFTFIAQSTNDVIIAQDPAGQYDVVIELSSGCGEVSSSCSNAYGPGAIERLIPSGLTVGTQYYFRVYDAATGASASTDVRIQVKTFEDGGLQSPYCAQTYVLSQSIFAERDDLGQLYSNPIVPVKGYAYRFKEVGGGLNVITFHPNFTPYISLGQVPGLEYGKTYDVSVRHKVKLAGNGVVMEYWSGFGTPCPISLTAIPPSTQLQDIYCSSSTDFFLADLIKADQVPGASQYRFTFVGGGETIEETTNSYGVFLYNVGTPDAGLQYNVVYSVSVEVNVNGIWSAPGPACDIFMQTQPEATAVRASYCNGTYEYPQNPNFILAETVLGADYYEWRAIPVGGGTPQTDITSGVSLAMHLTSIDFSAAGDWNIQVRAFVGGILGDYGSACPITINAAVPIVPNSDETAEIKSFSLSDMTMNIYPNPNDGTEFRISIDGLNENGIAEMFLRDVQGRLIAIRTYTYNEKSDFVWTTEQKLESGVYLLETRIGNEKITSLFTVR